MKNPVQAMRWSAISPPCLLAVLLSYSEPAGSAQPVEIVPEHALMISGSRSEQFRRTPITVDAVEAQIVAGTWVAPTAETVVKFGEQDERTWVPLDGKDGSFDDPSLRGGYAYVPVNVSQAGVYLLEAAGHKMVYVNGVPRDGDFYSTGAMLLPVALAEGNNDLLFAAGRGGFRVKLYPASSPIQFSGRDDTVPHLIVGEPVNVWAGVVLINATTETHRDLVIETEGTGLTVTASKVPPLLPLGISKVPIRFEGPAPQQTGKLEALIRVRDTQRGSEPPLAVRSIGLEIRNALDQHRRTYRSEVDGSVQYYAVKPAQVPADETHRPGMILTLHGAGVDADGHAACYAHRDWAHLVAATNRRPFGFDWEDWGRVDALDVLADAARHYPYDPRRSYLTGHSMGGHGTWHLGVTFPDRFAAIGPSAGWVSFFSYAGTERMPGSSPVQELLNRCTTPSDTLRMIKNLRHLGVYILHGDADSNVPVAEARTMRQTLADFHPDFAYYEQPGADHWWSVGRGQGTDCVDWPPLFRFFQDHVLPEPGTVRRVEFVTASPGVSASYRWATIDAQIKQYQPSSVSLRFEPEDRVLAGTTDNVARLRLDLTAFEPDRPLQLDVDDSNIKDVAWPKDGVLWLNRQQKGWMVAAPPEATEKNAQRCGPFKQAFGHHVLLVYGTTGNAEENAWALSKARYDADRFYYVGNGLLEVVADSQFTPAQFPERNVVLYGNADSNAAWSVLLADSPVQVSRGVLRVGQHQLCSDSLGGIFVRPRSDSATASVGVVTGTGMAGMRTVTNLPYFRPGVAYPDCLFVDASVWQDGVKGIRVVGFFGNDWTVENGEFAWQD